MLFRKKKLWIHGETLVTNAAKEINLSSSSRRCAVSCRNNPAAHIDMQHGSPFTARCQPHVKRKLLNGGSFKQCVGMLYFMLYDFFFFFPLYQIKFEIYLDSTLCATPFCYTYVRIQSRWRCRRPTLNRTSRTSLAWAGAGAANANAVHLHLWRARRE